MNTSPLNLSKPTSTSSESVRHTRNGQIIIAVLMITAIPSAIMFGYIGYYNNLPQLYIISATLITSIILDLLPLALMRQGNTNRAMLIVIFVFNINILIVPFLVQGLGVVVAMSAIMITIAIAGF